MVKVFPSFINDLFYLKRKFTDAEKLIIENLINSILREDRESSIIETRSFEGDPFPGELQGGVSDYCSETIFKEFELKKKILAFFLLKFIPKELMVQTKKGFK